MRRKILVNVVSELDLVFPTPLSIIFGSFFFSFSSGLMISCCWLLTAAGIWKIRVLEKWRRTKGDIEAGDIDSGCHAGLCPI